MPNRVDCTIISGLAALATVAALFVGCSAQSESSPAWRAAPTTFKDAISDAVALHGCDSVGHNLVAAQTQAESNFTNDAVSAGGAVGAGQSSPADWHRLSGTVDADDPRNPSDAMAVLVARDCEIASTLTEAHVSATTETIAAAYHAGTSSIIDNPTIPNLETRQYVQRVVSLSQAG